MLLNSQKKAVIKNMAWELLTYYFVEALDCHAVNNKQSPRHMI